MSIINSCCYSLLKDHPKLFTFAKLRVQHFTKNELKVNFLLCRVLLELVVFPHTRLHLKKIC